jgi:hypothetical protein
LSFQSWGGYICYASADIKALETLGYAEHICNYVVILDSWFYGKITQSLEALKLGLLQVDITRIRRKVYSQFIGTSVIFGYMNYMERRRLGDQA